MKHYLVDKQIVNDRMRQYMQNADKARLAQMAQVYRPSLGGRILAGLGGWMIAGGTRLKARYAEVASYQLPINRYPVQSGLRD